MTDLKRYADSMVVLPRKMTVDMINAWFAADRADKPVSECWDAAVEAFEQKKDRPMVGDGQALYTMGESTIEVDFAETTAEFPFKRVSTTSNFDQLVTKLREGFITCNSKPGGPYYVEIEYQDLGDAHELHRIICKTRIGGQ